MIVDVDASSPTPPFEQVRAGLAARIHDHSLPVGAKLPTVRGLADQLGLAPNTVARAYRELEEAGLIETRGRAGSFVSAAGDATRQKVHAAATEYAEVAHRLGIQPGEALEIAAAAIHRSQVNT